MSVAGLEHFATAMAAHKDVWTLIGGAACDIVLTEVGVPARATKDLDIVLLAREVNVPFASDLLAYLAAGSYEGRLSRNGDHCCWRFFRGKDALDGPALIELFAPAPYGMVLTDAQRVVPVHVGGDMDAADLSLSALLLDDGYDQWIEVGRIEINGVPVLRADHLIPLKAKAWLDLRARKAAGEQIDSRNIRKHLQDCARLFVALDPLVRSDVPKTIAGHMQTFLEEAGREEIDFTRWKLPAVSLEEFLGALRERYITPA